MKLNRRELLQRALAAVPGSILAGRAWQLASASTAVATLAGCTSGRSKEDQLQKLVIGTVRDVRTLDPAMANMALDGTIICNIHEPLTWYGRDLKLVPRLALSWETTDEARSWIFKLRQGVKFHDGTAFNADAVKYHFERLKNPATKSNRLTKVAMLEGMDVIDEYTIRFRMTQQYAVWPVVLRDAFASIVSPTAARAAGDPNRYKQHPVGTGPYKFVEYKPDQYVRLRRNPEYWQADQFHVEELEFRPIRESTTRLILLEQGELDIADLSYAHAEVVERAGRVKVERIPALRISYVGFNNMKPPFDDVRCRRAVNYAVNRDDIVKYAYRGNYDPSYGPLPPGLPAFNPEVTRYEYDPERAKKLLAEAGYANGFDVTLWSMDSASDRAMSETLGEQLRLVNIRLTVKQYDAAVYWDKFDAYMTNDAKWFPTKEGVFDLYIAGWTGGENAHGFLDPLFRSTSSSNSSFYKNEKLDVLLNEALRTADEATRDEIYRKIQVIVVDDAPWLFTYYSRLLIGINPRLENYHIHPAAEYEIQNVLLHAGRTGHV